MPSTGPYLAGLAGKTHAGIATRMTASFGTPAPLPGQPGFGTTTSDVMERETAEMEERLAKLKDDLSAEAEAREAASKVGGSRWRSARVDRGSVRSYANDVKLRHQYRLQRRPPHGISSSRGGRGHGTAAAGFAGGIINPQAGAGARAAAALRERDQYQRHRRWLKAAGGDDTYSIKDPTIVGAQKTEVNMSFSEQKSSSGSGGRCYAEKDVAQWSVDDTLQWLDGSLGLSKYRGVFQQNEISGPILLEVGLDDLDYMKVHILAHRKLILSGIEELRRRSDDGGGHTADVPPPAPLQRRSEVGGSRVIEDGGKGRGSPWKNGGASNSAIQDGGVHHQLPLAAAGHTKMQHWSHVKPLSDNQVDDTNGTAGSPNKRLADGEYDEQAAHSSFAAAVAAWRSGAGSSAGDQQQDRHNSTVAPHSSPLKRSAVGTVSRAPASGDPAQSAPRTNHQFSGQRSGSTNTNQLRTITPRSYTATGLLGVRHGKGHSECWVNPFGTPPGSRDDTGEYGIANTAQNAIYEELGSDGEAIILVSPPRRPRAFMTVPGEGEAKASPAVSAAGVSEEKGCTSCDWGDGNDDDDETGAKRQHAAFQRAVADWNKSGGGHEGIGNKRRSSSTIYPRKQEGELCDPGHSSSDEQRMAAGDEGATDAAPVSLSGGVETPRRATDALAESLRKQMDAEHREVARRMEQAKLALLEGLNDVERGHGGRKSWTKVDGQHSDDHDSRSRSDEKSDHREDHDACQEGKTPGDDEVRESSQNGWRWREKHKEVAWAEGSDRGEEQYKKERGPSSLSGGGEGKRDNSSDSDDDSEPSSLRSSGTRRCSGSSGDGSPRSDGGYEAEGLGVTRNPGGSVVEIEFVESVLGPASCDVPIDGREELTEYLVEEG